MNAMWRDPDYGHTTYLPLKWYLCGGNTLNFLGRDLGGGADKASALGAFGRAVSSSKHVSTKFSYFCEFSVLSYSWMSVFKNSQYQYLYYVYNIHYPIFE